LPEALQRPLPDVEIDDVEISSLSPTKKLSHESHGAKGPAMSGLWPEKPVPHSIQAGPVIGVGLTRRGEGGTAVLDSIGHFFSRLTAKLTTFCDR
jgi:hypothetical protein